MIPMTNHNPNITSSSATGSFTEDANTTGSTVDHVLTGTMNFTDSDHSDTHTTTTALKTAVWSGGSTLPSGALTKFQTGMTSSILTDSNGSGKLKWTFSEDDRDFDFLAKGETLVLTYEITLKDNHGGTNKETVKITITGTDASRSSRPRPGRRSASKPIIRSRSRRTPPTSRCSSPMSTSTTRATRRVFSACRPPATPAGFCPAPWAQPN